MPLDIAPVPHFEWSPLPRSGCHGVDGKVLVRRGRVLIALLRFEAAATIDEHAGDDDAEVICLEGEGMTSVGGEQARVRAGERVRWPAGTPHRLWTTGSPLLALVVHVPAAPGSETDAR